MFKRVQFPRRSNFAQLGKATWKPKRIQSQVNQVLNDNQGFAPESQSNSGFHSAHSSAQRQVSLQDDLNLDLNLGPANYASRVLGNLAPSVAMTSSAPVLCRHCHSASHPRCACKAAIKCHKCFGWGHVAVSCNENWRFLQRSVNGKSVEILQRILGITSITPVGLTQRE